MNRYPENYRLMPGRRVAEHLLAAESASLRNETYDFPGGVLFPINNFDMDNDDHLPFPDDHRTCWNMVRLLRGHKIFKDMISKYLDDTTLKFMKFVEMPEFAIETKFKLTPRNQRQPQTATDIVEEIISPNVPEANDEQNQHAIGAEQLVNVPPIIPINDEESAHQSRATSRTEVEVTIPNAPMRMGSMNPTESADIDMIVNIDPADNQSIQLNANITNAESFAENAQVPMEIDIDNGVNVDANLAEPEPNQANEDQAEHQAHVPDNDNPVNFQAELIDPDAVPLPRRLPVRRPRPRRNLPPQQDNDNDRFQVDPPQIRDRRRNRRNQNPRPIIRPIPLEDGDDFLNLLDLFENQLQGQAGRPVLPTDFDLPISNLSEELWPQDVVPYANVRNENVQNDDVQARGFTPPQIDYQENVNVVLFEDIQQSGPVQESSPVRQPVPNEPQSPGLPPILEIDITNDNNTVGELNIALIVAPMPPESTHGDQAIFAGAVQVASVQMEAIDAQVAPEAEQQNQIPANEPVEIEINQPNPMAADNQPVENDAEAERQLIRAELARWHRIWYRGTYPRNRAPPRPLPRQNFDPADFAVRRVPHAANNMVHPRLALEDMTEMYRVIHEFLSDPNVDSIPIMDYLRRFPVGEQFKALIGLADAVEENSIFINIENDQIKSFRRVPDQQ